MPPENDLIMHDLAIKLSQLAPLFSDILRIGAGLGLSIGVLHHGEVIYKSHFGRREAASPEPPNDETMYYIASLTKAITAAAVAILVDRGQLKWDTPLAEYLPEFGERHDEIGRQTTLVDVLSHRTGLTGANALWVQRSQEFMMPKHEQVRTTTYLRSALPFRQSFCYNNWGYGLATALIEHVTGSTYGKFVKENIFDPLNLQRITIYDAAGTNVSSANMVRDDGTVCPVKAPPNSDQTGLAGAGAGKASLTDLLQFYKSLLSTYKAEQNQGCSRSKAESTPFRQVSNLFDAKVQIGDADITKNAYALGWVKSVLPQRLGTIGMNAMCLGGENMPVIGKGCQTDTAIVVLSNTLGFADTADWVGQLILQTVIGDELVDFKEWAQKAKTAHFKQFSDLVDELERGMTKKPPSQSLQAYAGRYYNTIGDFVLDVSVRGDQEGLSMRVQDLEDVFYDLVPYDGDTFYWPCDREEELCKEMMFPWPWSGVHKISFSVASDGSVQSLSWGHDPCVEPEVFSRKAETNGTNEDVTPKSPDHF